jgi:hypothetical protein
MGHPNTAAASGGMRPVWSFVLYAQVVLTNTERLLYLGPHRHMRVFAKDLVSTDVGRLQLTAGEGDSSDIYPGIQARLQHKTFWWF